jgi:glutathione synthase/RimK-type ligase-like ATP-grasp enzyme
MAVTKKKSAVKKLKNNGVKTNTVLKATKTVPTKKVAAKKASVQKKEFSGGRTLRIRSRHPSVGGIRKEIIVPVVAVYRHGSETAEPDIKYEINPIRGVQCASSKFLMKDAFMRNNVKSAPYFFLSDSKKSIKLVTGVTANGGRQYQEISRNQIEFPLVAKLNYGSRGRGMVKIDDLTQFDKFVASGYRQGYYFEKFLNYNREYRLHVDAQGCFYSCRKMLKQDTPEGKRYFRNDSNSVWITQYTPIKQGNTFVGFNNQLKADFDQPINWKEVVAECVKALKAVGLDVGACDLRIQGSTDGKGKARPNPDFFIVEINSAPSFGEITEHMYRDRLPQTLKKKYGL